MENVRVENIENNGGKVANQFEIFYEDNGKITKYFNHTIV